MWYKSIRNSTHNPYNTPQQMLQRKKHPYTIQHKIPNTTNNLAERKTPCIWGREPNFLVAGIEPVMPVATI